MTGGRPQKLAFVEFCISLVRHAAWHGISTRTTLQPIGPLDKSDLTIRCYIVEVRKKCTALRRWNTSTVAKPDMQPSDSPFSNEADIKEIPHLIDGTFAWLSKTPTHNEWAIGDYRAGDLPAQLDAAMASARKCGLKLPAEFVTFIRTREWHNHLRSVTACYLNLAETVLPFANGFLLRFLHDQQDCAFWYLYLNKDGSDHCVVMSYEYFDADDMDYEIDELKDTDFHVCETSFERFMSRFWLENEILFAKYDETDPPDVDPRFLEMYSG